MISTTRWLGAALAVLFCAIPSSLAGGFYVGAGVGDAKVDADFSTPSLGGFEFDESDFAWKVYGGVRLVKFLALEGAYVDLGSPRQTFPTAGGPVEWNVEFTGVSAHAVGVIPLPWLRLFGKVGVIRWDGESSVGGAATGSADDSGTDLAYGVGATLQFERFGLRAEYEVFDIDGADSVSMLSAGVSWGF